MGEDFGLPAVHRRVVVAARQLLGGFGLLLGVLGLAVVLLRNVWERRSELALLRARGGSLPGLLARLLVENALVVLPAAALGVLAALTLVGRAVRDEAVDRLGVRGVADGQGLASGVGASIARTSISRSPASRNSAASRSRSSPSAAAF